MTDDLADPFIVPLIEGREVLGGGAIEVRGPFNGGTVDFLLAPAGVLVLVELPEEVVELSCFVGDLLGDWQASAIWCPSFHNPLLLY